MAANLCEKKQKEWEGEEERQQDGMENRDRGMESKGRLQKGRIKMRKGGKEKWKIHLKSHVYVFHTK